LHKLNGVKIAVPIAKMSLEDLEYVEAVTGISLDEDKPLSNVKRNSNKGASSSSSAPPKVGASVEPPQPKVPEYDWFQFFLECEVPLGVCERYAQAFNKESMTESILPDVDASVLRNLGLREGDILKVMRHLDQRFGRNKKGKEAAGDEDGGGLFSGPGGALRNNTRKGRPAPAVQTSDVVDPKAFGVKDEKPAEESSSRASPPQAAAKASASSGFDDDAWDVKPSKKAEEAPPQPARSESAPAPAPTPAPRQTPNMTGAMQELSLLTAPLEPTRTAASQPTLPPLPASATPPAQAPPPQIPQPTGASPAFFAANNLAAQQRQRPTPPQLSGGQGALAPPPGRPLSAPLSAQPSGFAPPPMMPQMTGAVQGRVAPPGQSLEEMNQSRLQQQQFALQQQQLQQMQHQQQQQFPQMAPQMTGFPGQQQPLQQFQTGMPQNGPFMQPMMTGNVPPQQFTPLHNQMTGFPGGQFPQQQQQPFNPQATGLNSFLPPALEPQRTGMPPFQPQPTGFNSAPLQPLQPQQTGPPPPVRFGVSVDAKKLAPQATGRRANLSQASKSNQNYMINVDETDKVQHRTIPSVSDFTDKTACSHSHSALRVVILTLRLLHSDMVERGEGGSAEWARRRRGGKGAGRPSVTRL
jgi:actin cytoskeleton-regulatory complex protein SLA1